MKKTSLPAVLALVASVATLHADPVDWSGYARSFDITFPGYTGSGTLTDFPVLVRLSAARNDFRYDKCRVANGGDLRFSDVNGNLLAHEIDTWNPDGESLVWVKVPSLNASTKIIAHYGCDSPVAALPATQVWANGYVGVWHMDEDSRKQSDSTENGKTIDGDSTYQANMAFGVDGAVGKAVEQATPLNNGTYRGGFQRTDTDSLYSGTKTLTLEMWCCQRDIVNDKYIFRLKNSQGTTEYAARFSWPLSSGDSTKTQLNHSVLMTNLVNETTSSFEPKYSVSTSSVQNVWTHYALVVDNETLHRVAAYCNGDAKYTKSITDDGLQLFAGAGTFAIGNASSSGSQAFPGSIDEVRVSSVARSDDWVQATYDTVHDESFAVFEMQNDWKKYSHTFSVSFQGYAGSTALTNFPVLVQISTNNIAGFSYTDCRKPDGGDLRFADDEGHLLASEVDTWDTNGVSTIWVKVPSIVSTNTTIKAYYGWAFAPSVNPKAVWSNGYVGVWHLGESARPLKDSGANGLHFARTSKTASKPAEYEVYNTYGEADSVIGRAMRINPAVNGEDAKKGGLYADDPDSLVGGFSAMTVEIWAKSEGTVSSRTQTLFTKRQYNEPKKAIATFLYNSSYKPISYFDFQKDGETNTLQVTGNALDGTARGQWKYHVATFDMANTIHTNYLNGAKDVRLTKDISSLGDHLSTDDGLCLGNRPTPGNLEAFSGLLDELRISNVARSADWVKATYDTIMDNPADNTDFAAYTSAKENGVEQIIFFR